MYRIACSDFVISPFLHDVRFVANDVDLRRAKSLEFHVLSDDYFQTLATVLDLFRQMTPQQKNGERLLLGLTDDLLYLQKNYKIEPKHKGSRVRR
ncbi:MAG: hypothetical protein WCT49_01255 [Candidatus Paceibacterota bacterium]|jgi:hypothetical protein|nr:hypothetical protein [Candidatus Paceibacterota bacterium]